MDTTMGLPPNEKTFTITATGDTSKQPYTGEFRTVCMPSLRQKADAAVMEAQLNRDLVTLDNDTVLYHRMISQLAHRLKAAPQWWIEANNGQDLLDANVVFEVFKNCAEAEREWREKVWGEKKPDAIESTSKPAAETK